MLAALFLAALMMRVDEGNADDDSQAHVSALLILVVLAVFVVLFFYIIKEVRSELRKDFKAIRSSTMAKSPKSQWPKEVAPIKVNSNLTNDNHSWLGTTF